MKGECEDFLYENDLTVRGIDFLIFSLILN